MDMPTAVMACVGCGCVGCGGLAATPDQYVPSPLTEVKAAVMQVAENFGFGSSDYSFGGQTWNDQRGWN